MLLYRLKKVYHQQGQSCRQVRICFWKALIDFPERLIFFYEDHVFFTDFLGKIWSKHLFRSFIEDFFELLIGLLDNHIVK